MKDQLKARALSLAIFAAAAALVVVMAWTGITVADLEDVQAMLRDTITDSTEVNNGQDGS